jgi:S1-C subfamily serine protease
LLPALPLLLAACVTRAPLAPVPAPLPEALAWAPPADGRAFLGLKTEENDSGSLDDLFFRPGVRVRRAVENSPAAAAGVVPGDVVLALNGRAVNDPAALDALVEARAAGERVELDVQRGDSVFTVPVVLAASRGGPAEPAELSHRLDPARSQAGWATGLGGAVLVSAAEGSPFPRAGIPVGSVVLAVDGEPVASDRELIRRLAARPPGTTVAVRWRPAGGGTPVVSAVRLLEQPTRLTGLELPILFRYEGSVDGRRTEVDLLDLWIVQLFSYRRDRGERTWVLLELFGWDLFVVSTGVGELD